jgi:hypothetical protein
MMFNQSPTDEPTSSPLGGLRKVSIKFQGHTPASVDPTTGVPTPASGPDHGLAEISLESHAPAKPGGMTKEAAPTPQQFGGGTKLDPMQEALFPSWMRANGIDPGSIDGHTFDYRGTYKQTNGQVHPPGTLQNTADTINKLHQRLVQPVPSHTPTAAPQFDTPGSPSFHDVVQGKVDTMHQYGASDDQEPIRMLLNMLKGGVR